MPSIKFRMQYLTETKRTAVYETDDPLAPVSRVYVQKSWLAQAALGSGNPVVAPAITLTVERVEHPAGGSQPLAGEGPKGQVTS